MTSIKHAIESAGHTCVLGEKSIASMGRKLPRIVRFVEATKADAWIVYSGSREVLEWFAAKGLPVLAIGGRAEGLPVAWSRTDVGQAMKLAVDSLCDIGHRRIVMISALEWRKPVPSRPSQAFLTRLQENRINTSEFNVPEWTETAEGFDKLMRSLFCATPPTALVLAEPKHCVAALAFLAKKNLRVPGDVSMVLIVPDPVFCLHHPAIAHFKFPIPFHVNRATRWVEAVSRGNADCKTTICHAEFIPGGTIAQANADG